MRFLWLFLVPFIIIWSVALTLRVNKGGYSESRQDWQRPKLPVWGWLLILLVSVTPILNWVTIGFALALVIISAGTGDIVGEIRWWGGVPKWLTKEL